MSAADDTSRHRLQTENQKYNCGRQREWSFRNCTHTSSFFRPAVRDRIDFLGEEVTDVSASSIVAQMLFLEAQDPDKDIQFYINSPGGSVTAGFAIYDTMQYIKCDVSTICIGLAASFGAFLVAGGAKGNRIALSNAEIMIHQPLIGGNGVHRPVTDMQRVTEQMQKTKQHLIPRIREDPLQKLPPIRSATTICRRRSPCLWADRQNH